LTRRPKSTSTPNDDETAEKKLSTKKLRRFVIRRRWQVNPSSSNFNHSVAFLESGQCFTSIKTYGNDVVKNTTTQFAYFFLFFCSIQLIAVFFISSRVSFTKTNIAFSFLLIVVTCGSIQFVHPENIECVCV
jgi:hypothetical protein